MRGLSPGFHVRPGGETVEERGTAILRTIRAADLIEISAVTKPAYPQAQIEARNWQPIGEVAKRMTPRSAAIRWRCPTLAPTTWRPCEARSKGGAVPRW